MGHLVEKWIHKGKIEVHIFTLWVYDMRVCCPNYSSVGCFRMFQIAIDLWRLRVLIASSLIGSDFNTRRGQNKTFLHASSKGVSQITTGKHTYPAAATHLSVAGAPALGSPQAVVLGARSLPVAPKPSISLEPSTSDMGQLHKVSTATHAAPTGASADSTSRCGMLATNVMRMKLHNMARWMFMDYRFICWPGWTTLSFCVIILCHIRIHMSLICAFCCTACWSGSPTFPCLRQSTWEPNMNTGLQSNENGGFPLPFQIRVSSHEFSILEQLQNSLFKI